MDDLLTKNVTEMTGLSFDCGCGRHHTVDIRRIVIGDGCLPEVVNAAAELKAEKIFMIADSNTYEVCGRRVEEMLGKAGFEVKAYIFRPLEPLVPDETALGRLLVEMDAATSLIVTVGTGTLGDLAKMLSFKTRIPYIIAATAPSMDGFASIGSPLIIGGVKLTFSAVYPAAIIADTSILREAPTEMLQAGFGDIVGKYTALTDWVLARELKGEYYCETSVRMMEKAVGRCIENAEAFIRRDKAAVQYVTEALILSGVAMGIVGSSRPASGAEHHMAHYWELDALAGGRRHPLHGNSVGVATVVSASIYQMLRGSLPAACKPPEPEAIVSMLRSTGACDNPRSLGIGRELFHNTILHAMEVRERYTILRFAAENGRLPEFADTLTRRFYGD
jgi:glycerol-1-phosphate dehydrogenase [NAD(P)+]